MIPKRVWWFIRCKHYVSVHFETVALVWNQSQMTGRGMKYFAASVLASIVLLAGCKSVPGVQTGNVEPQTIDDIARCSMGVSSSVGVVAGASIEKTGGKVDGAFSSKLEGALVDKFGKEDAKEMTKLFMDCMEKQKTDRTQQKKQAAVSACHASVKCDYNVVAGGCVCRKEIYVAAKKYKWNEQRAAQEYARNCSYSGVRQCWPPGDLTKMRVGCELELKDAGISLPTFNSDTCEVS